MNTKHLKRHIKRSKAIFFLITLWCIGCKQVPKMDVDYKALENEAMTVYAENPKHAADLLETVAKHYASEKKHKKAGITYLNIAGIYDEYQNDYEQAYDFAKASFSNAVKDQDTLAQANLLKYLGYLNGLKGQIEMGKKEILFAIDLFSRQGDQSGVAVSHFNLARVFFMDKDLEESQVYFEKANDYWRSMPNNGRIFSNNIFGIELYHALENPKKRDALIAENDALKNEVNFPDVVWENYEKTLNMIQSE